MDREGYRVNKENEAKNKEQSNPNACQTNPDKLVNNPCPQLPGTIFRIFIPAGFVINLLNLLELTSPAGICLILRVPALEGNLELSNLLSQIQKAGGTVEVVK